MEEETVDDESIEISSMEEPFLKDGSHSDKVVNEDYIFWTRKEDGTWGTAIFVLTTLTMACRNCLPISAVVMAEEFNWDKSETGLVLSSFYWGYPTTQILSGYLSDRFGGDQVATIAGIGWGIQTAIFPFFVYTFDDKPSQLAFLAVIRVIFGMTEAFHYPTIASIAALKVQKERRSFFYTSTSAGGHAGIILSGSIGSLLITKYGWKIIFYCFGILSIVWACAIRIFLMKKRCIQRCQTIGKKKDSPGKLTTRQTWKILLRHRSFWAMVFIYFCNNYAWHLLFSWMPTFFTETFPGQKAWVFNVVPWSFPIFTTMASGYIADRMMSNGVSRTTTRKFLQTLSSLTYASSLMVLGHMNCFIPAVILISFAFVIESLGAAGAYANNQDLAPAHAGAVYGVMNSFGAIPGFLGVYISGHIMDYFNSWNIVFSLTGSIMFVGWFVYMLFGSGKQIVNDEAS
ncbi:voltage-gated purine nucleotide uniporter SLC17A9-like [Glandiceps talaboti]